MKGDSLVGPEYEPRSYALRGSGIPTPRLSSGFAIFVGGRFIAMGFYMMFREPFLNFSFRKKSRPEGSGSIYYVFTV